MGIYLGISSAAVGLYGLVSGDPLPGIAFLAAGIALFLFFRKKGVQAP